MPTSIGAAHPHLSAALVARAANAHRLDHEVVKLPLPFDIAV
jgi:hypothetical protein